MCATHVLLVEDNLDNLNLMQFLLERDGYRVSSARNGRQAMEKAQALHPDVVLMDLSLPELDGWTAARLMRQTPSLANLPLIAVTAHTLPGDRRKALDSGFDSYISKPLNVHQFGAMVAQALEEKHRSQAGA